MYLRRLTVFKNKNKLSPRYIPPTLPHREEQLRLLFNIYEDVLEDPSQVYLRPVQIIGGIGTGKTSTTMRFTDDLQAKAKERKINLGHVYANLKLQGSSRTVLYRYLLDKAAPEIRTASLSGDEMLHQLVKYLESKNRYLILSLDEIEYFMKHTKENVIYDLTRLNELTPENPCRVVGLIIISRGTNYYNLLDKSELSSLGRIYVEFPPYTPEQIRDILLSRSDEAFKKGAVPDDVINLIAEVTAASPVDGDIRYALDLLLYAGNLADNQGSETLKLDYVRRVHGEVYREITSQDLMDLPDPEKVVLLAVARTLLHKKAADVSFQDIQSECAFVSEDFKIKLENLDYALQDLDDRGIIEIKSLVHIGISSIPTEDLIRYLASLVDRIKGDLRDRER